MGNIGRSITHPEIYLIVIFFLIDGLTNPNFQDYTYFFLMEEVGVSKFMFGMIELVGQIISVAGVVLYEKTLKSLEPRYVVMIGVGVRTLGGFLNYAFAMRWNLNIGVSDYALLFFTDVVFSSVQIAFSTLPLMALFAKITPKRIEGTIFAFLTGTWNLD
jgi:Na+/melibiose symporter-like transporter